MTTNYDVKYTTEIYDDQVVFTLLEGACEGQKFMINFDDVDEKTEMLQCTLTLVGEDLSYTIEQVEPYVQAIVHRLLDNVVESDL